MQTLIPHVDTRCNTSGLLTATGAATTYDTTVAIAFSINGKEYAKAAITSGVTPTTDGNSAALSTLAASRGCAILWCLNAAGTVGIFQGEVITLDAANAPLTALVLPSVDLTTWCPFAYMTLKNGSTGSTFTIGSSNWNATGMTVLITNIGSMPNRPPTT